jgi:hypothetical protein
MFIYGRGRWPASHWRVGSRLLDSSTELFRAEL